MAIKDILLKIIMKVIKINSSNLSSFIGLNPYQTRSSIFFKLWKRYFPESFFTIQSLAQLNKDRDLELKYQILDNTTFTNELFKANDIPINIYNEIKKAEGNREEMNKKADELIKKIQEQKLPKEIEDKIEKSIRSSFRTNYGTKKEGDAIKFYQKLYKSNIITNISIQNKIIYEDKDYGISIVGKLDAIKRDDKPVILEIKNRSYQLFKEVRTYEFIQCQAYMYLYEIPECELIQFLNDKKPLLDKSIIEFDEKYWKKTILKKVKENFLLLLQIINDKELGIQFMRCGIKDADALLDKIQRG